MSISANLREVPTDFLSTLSSKSVPAAPGHNWDDPAFRKSHAKPQALTNEFTGKSYHVPPPVAKPTPPPEVKNASAIQLAESIHAAHSGISEQLTAKSYATLDDKILRFYAYITETIRESPLENTRYRRVTIFYFCDDDTILIQEPHIPNSGIQGGCLLKRQKVKANWRQLEQNPEDAYITINHFNVGIDLMLNSIVFTIYDCDARTRAFMEEIGIFVNDSVAPPVDPFMATHNAKIDVRESCKFGVLATDKTVEDSIRVQRFIQDSGKVLRYFAVFDDREAVGGKVRELEVLMFVEDDTVTINEHQTTNESVPGNFMSRRRLPKDSTHSKKAVELTFAHRINGVREPFLGHDAYYLPQDLGIGRTINVYGRSVFLHDCDDFTREFYRTNYGIQQGKAVDVKDFRAAANPKPKLPLPPYTGFGTHEDSMSSCKTLVLKAPKGNPIDPHSRSDILRFQMKLHQPDRKEDERRVFVLNYYVEDGEMMIQEHAERNSGFTGGKFIRKQRMEKSTDGIKPVFYTLDDLKKGNVLTISSFVFEITDCDEHTAKFLAFPATKGSDPSTISKVPADRLLQLLTALKGLLTVRYITQTEAFRAFDKDRDGVITLAELLAGLKATQVTAVPDEAAAILKQISDDSVIHHNDFFQWFSRPVALRLPSADTALVDIQPEVEALHLTSGAQDSCLVRDRVLKQLKERLEGRCLNGFEMFRLMSTMPRAYKGRRAEIHSLTNPHRDSVVTPVQLRRCLDEVLGFKFSADELAALLAFFFPSLPSEHYLAAADFSTAYGIQLKEFQARFNAMSEVGHIPAAASDSA